MCGKPVPAGATACPDDGSTFLVDGAAPPKTLAYGTSETVAAMEFGSLVGTRLGDYEVLEHVGDGGMGIVYRGVQPLIKKRVAIKVLKPEFAQDAAQVQRLFAEAEAVNSIGHRNIIDIFNVGQLPDGRHYIVMEFLEGEPLDAFLRRRSPLPAHEVLGLLGELCVPLHAAHLAGVIHRDLKPSNVFLCTQADGSRYLKLLDFGLAKKGMVGGRANQTSVNQIAGTPDFMAPEQARALAVSAQTDLYALGVMAFQMLTGRLPFLGATPMDVMLQHVSAPCPTPSSVERGVPGELDAFVLWLMAKKPEDRPRSAEDVRFELKRLDGLLAEASTQTRASQLKLQVMKDTFRVLPEIGSTPNDLTPAAAMAMMGPPGSSSDLTPAAGMPGAFGVVPNVETLRGPNSTELMTVPDDDDDAAAADTNDSDPGTPTSGPNGGPTVPLPPRTEPFEGLRARHWRVVALGALLVGGLALGWLLGEGSRPGAPLPAAPVPMSLKPKPPPEPTPVPLEPPPVEAVAPVAPTPVVSPPAVPTEPTPKRPRTTAVSPTPTRPKLAVAEGPSAESLRRRIAALETKLAKRADADPSAGLHLNRVRAQLENQPTPEQLKALNNRLDGWESKFLPPAP